MDTSSDYLTWNDQATHDTVDALFLPKPLTLTWSDIIPSTLYSAPPTTSNQSPIIHWNDPPPPLFPPSYIPPLYDHNHIAQQSETYVHPSDLSAPTQPLPSLSPHPPRNRKSKPSATPSTRPRNSTTSSTTTATTTTTTTTPRRTVKKTEVEIAESDSDSDASFSDYTPSSPPSRSPSPLQKQATTSSGSGTGTTTAARHKKRTPTTVERTQNVPLPPPIPVPNLTKKSRGRKVPSSVPSTSGDDRTTTQSGAGAIRKRGYTCRVPGCGKCFIRGEHLKRHVRSIHTYDKR